MRRPPVWSERCLRLMVPRGPRGDAVIGDLREEFARRVGAGGEARAAAGWYRREAVVVGLRIGFERLVRRVRRRSPGAGEGIVGGRPGGGGSGAGDWLQDIRLAGRHLRRNPGFTAIVLVVFALGIGANAGTFALIDALAFRPLNVERPDELVALYGHITGDDDLLGFSWPDYVDYREGTSTVFSAVAGFSESAASLSGPGGAVVVWTNMVTPDYFEVLRPRAGLGRLLGADDESAVVLSHGLWQRRFGGDAGIVGRVITLNGHPFTVVGVTERGFMGTRLFSYAPELWVPVRAYTQIVPGNEGLLDRRSGGLLSLVGRLSPGVNMAQAEAVADRVALSLGESFPATHADRDIVMYSNTRPVNPWAFEPSQLRVAGVVALAGVALVLLIACANVAGLQLAQSAARRHEVAVRVSLGARTMRVARPLILESLLLSVGGGTLGIALAVWLVRSSSGLLPPLDFAPAFEARIDWRVIGFTIVASTLAAILAGLLPVLRQRSVDPASTLRSESGGSGRSSRLLDGLVVAQMAFSLVVLVAAGLFVQSLRHARDLDPGFALDNGIVVNVYPGLQGYSAEQEQALYDQLLESLRELPAVRGATRANHLPLDGSSSSQRVSAEGRTASTDEQSIVLFYAVEPGFFETLGVPLREGRGFTDADDAAAPVVAVINETLARQLWPAEPATGRLIRLGTDVATVVGVVADTRMMMLDEPPQPMVALSLRQERTDGGSILIRTAADPGALAPLVRQTIAELDPDLAFSDPKTLQTSAAYTLTAARSGAIGATTFGLLALLLTAAGLYGVVAWSVARRVREIGIRITLGARARTVVAMIVGHGMRLTAIGLVIGVALALATGRVLAGMLYGIAPTDLPTIVAGLLVLAAVALLASALPSLRAASVDPISVLRGD